MITGGRIVSANALSDAESFICPNCGAEVAAGATFCRECGASDDAGWSDDGDDELDDDFDYDEFVHREFPQHAPAGSRTTAKQWMIRLIVIVLCLLLLGLAL